MAKKLSVQIALEGAEQIRKDLESIGEEGANAYLKIAKAAKEAGGFANLKPEEVTKSLAEMNVTAKDTATILAAVDKAGKLDTLVKGVQSAEKAIGRLTNAWKIFTRVLAPLSVVGAAVTGLNNMATATENLIVKLGDLATRGNISIDRLDGLRRVFMASGGSVEDFTKIFEKFVGDLDQVKADKIAALKDQFQALKDAGWGKDAIDEWFNRQAAAVDRTTASGKNAADKYAEFAKRIAGLSTNAERFAAVQREFGSATQQQVDALVKVGQAAIRNDQKLKTFTAAQLAQAQANQKAVTELSNAWQRLNEIIGTLGMGQTLTNMLTRLVQAFSVGLEVIELGFQKLPAAASAAWNAILAVAMPVVTTISQAWQGFWMAFNNGLALIGAGWNSLWSGLQGIATSVLGMLTSAWDGFVGAITSAAGAISSAFDSVMGVINSVIEAINNAWQALMKLLGASGGGGGASAPAAAAGGLMGFAGGGQVRGRGTGTSDSNLAWVSRGEHIMPARAVRQPGVLAFLEALRRSGGNLSRVLEGMGRFALGGMVPRSIPAFAGGGLVGGMSNVTIQFPGLPEIGGLRAPSAVVDELRRAAAMAQVRSGGRKPSRYG